MRTQITTERSSDRSDNPAVPPVIRRNDSGSMVEKRTLQLLSKLEKKLEEDSASSLHYDDIAFQLADLKEQVEDIAKEKSRSENIYYWIILFMCSFTLLIVAYAATYLINYI